VCVSTAGRCGCVRTLGKKFHDARAVGRRGGTYKPSVYIYIRISLYMNIYIYNYIYI